MPLSATDLVSHNFNWPVFKVRNILDTSDMICIQGVVTNVLQGTNNTQHSASPILTSGKFLKGAVSF
jgi:hypothetical protein